MKVKEVLSKEMLAAWKAAWEPDLPHTGLSVLLRLVLYFLELSRLDRRLVKVFSDVKPLSLLMLGPYPFIDAEEDLDAEVDSEEEIVTFWALQITCPSVLSEIDAAAHLDISLRTLQRWEEKGMRSFKFGRSKFYLQSDLDRFAQRAGKTLV